MSLNRRREPIRRTVSHNIERPPPSNLAVHTHNGNAECCCKKCLENKARLCAGTKRATMVPSSNASAVNQNVNQIKKYSEPQLNTAIRFQNEMMLVQGLQPVPLKQDVSLTPRSKAIIAPKLTQKMNFRPGATVFKNLVPLNVNDSIILPRHLKPMRRRVTESQRNGNANYEPELRDFVEELDKLEYVIPEAELDLHITHEKFDYLQSYKDVYDLKII